MSTLAFNTEVMAAQADNPFSAATDLADHLVRGGMPFRSAHGVVGKLVRDALAGVAPLNELVMNHPDLGPDAAHLLEPGVSVRQRNSPGGGAPEAVVVQRQAFDDLLAADNLRLSALPNRG